MLDADKLPWSEVAWNASALLIEEMRNTAFVQGLVDGTLPVAAFSHYLQQDVIYMANYGEEMRLMSEMLGDDETGQLFSRLSADAVESEYALHEMLCERFDVHHNAEASVVTKDYIAHTRCLVDEGRIALALAALLPCFKVYNELGRYMIERCRKDDNPYLDWIHTYSSPLMDECVSVVSAACDAYVASMTQEERLQMLDAYVRSVEYEVQFFNQNGTP